MTVFVLVHGAYHGGWCWRDVVPVLRACGHDVYDPSLTGLGDRAHLAIRDINLDTHISDIENLILSRDLRDVVLVGHSYGGVVIGGVADRLLDVIRGLVFVDALIPENGKSVLDHQTPERAQYLRERAENNDGWRMPPLSAALYGVENETDAAWVDGKCTDHPLACFTQVQTLGEAWKQVPDKAFVRCTQSGLDYMDRYAEQAVAAPDWQIHYLPTGHDCMVTEPDHLSAILLTLA